MHIYYKRIADTQVLLHKWMMHKPGRTVSWRYDPHAFTLNIMLSDGSHFYQGFITDHVLHDSCVNVLYDVAKEVMYKLEKAKEPSQSFEKPQKPQQDTLLGAAHHWPF